MSRKQLADEIRMWRGIRAAGRREGHGGGSYAAFVAQELHHIAQRYYQPRTFFGG